MANGCYGKKPVVADASGTSPDESIISIDFIIQPDEASSRPVSPSDSNRRPSSQRSIRPARLSEVEPKQINAQNPVPDLDQARFCIVM